MHVQNVTRSIFVDVTESIGKKENYNILYIKRQNRIKYIN